MGIKCPKCNFDNPLDSKSCKECGSQLIPSEEISAPAETLETPKKELTRGTTFAGRYEIIEELGKGDMGKVYRVEDKKIKEEVTLKLIKPEIASDKKTIERFSNELKISRKIRHKNVSGMYNLEEENGTYYITMEYVPGEDLKSVIRRSGQLAVGTTINIAKQVCEGLSEAHELGVVHRDLKPQNIMIDEKRNVRIMDFGIARSLKAKGITRAGVMIGTPEYMSPEQVEGKEADQRSDVYSLGVILYEMLTGRMPFQGDTPLSIAMKRMTEVPKDPRAFNAQLPEALSKLILKCLEMNKEKRYQSAGEVSAELMNIEKGIPITPRERTIEFNLRKLFLPALTVVALVIIAGVIWQIQPRRQIEVRKIMMPQVTDMSLEEAISAVLERGFQLGKIHILSGEGREGNIVSQSPEAGILVELDSLVDLYFLGAQSSPHTLVDQILKSLPWGNIAFYTPKSMNLQDIETIRLRLSMSEPIDELKRQLEKTIETYEEEIDIEASRIRVSNSMEARMTGSAFHITEITPEEQAVSAKEVTEWKWEVKAIEAGLQTLHLTLTAILNIDDRDTRRAIRTFDKKIKVKVTPTKWFIKFLSNNWQWIATAILIPIIIMVWKVLKKKREQKKKRRKQKKKKQS